MSSFEPSSTPTTDAARPPRPAATLVVVRDGAQGVEVLLLCRAQRGDLNSGAWVFPGGMVDAVDALANPVCTGPGDAAASERLSLPGGGLAFHVAALRECFEECGLLLASDANGREPVPSRLAGLQPWRGLLHRGERSVLDFAAETGLRLATDRLAYLSHWLTPLGYAKRFDTRFFVAVAPAGQHAEHDGEEITAHRWLRCADALSHGEALKLMGPTRVTLQSLAHFECCADLMAWARSAREVPRILPRIALGADGPRPLLPNDPAWAEIGRLDPQGLGSASCRIVAGRAVRLSPHVIRVTAGNPGAMTGPGTNGYLVGGGQRNEWAVIDPGPADAAHVQALLDAAPGAISRIFVTHTHLDHSPAAALLQRRTGARTLGRVAAFADRAQDARFVPDEPLSGGERIELDQGLTLRVVHTPGHASNHLCYLLEEEKTLFTGDHVMQGSTVVINPPDGDMAAYIASMRSLAGWTDTAIEWLAPGHGFLIGEPQRAFEWILAHRLQREAKVLDVLRRHGCLHDEALLESVYDEVTPGLHGAARRSLLAHLLKLQGEGRVGRVDGGWSLQGPA